MITKFKLWDMFGTVSSIFSVNRHQPLPQNAALDVFPFTGMSLDIAMSTDIHKAIGDALALIQTQVQHTLGADVFLLLPSSLKYASDNQTFQVYFSPSLSPPSQVLDQLLHQREQLQAAPNNHIEELSNDINGYLVLMGQEPMRSEAQVKQVTAAFKEELSRGIAAWQTQQKNIELAITEERKAHAAELHDSMAQVLAYMRMRTAKLSSMCDEQRYQPLKEMTEDLSVQAHGAYRQARELITSSRLSLDGDSLKAALDKAVAEFESRSGIVFEIDNRTMSGGEVQSTDDVQVLFIVREALSNIVRHSRASHARVCMLSDAEQGLIIRVEDNGRGISHKPARKDSYGLKIMKERAQRINAKLTICPRENGEGTAIELTIPKRIRS